MGDIAYAPSHGLPVFNTGNGVLRDAGNNAVDTGVMAISAGTNVTITGTAQNPIINASGGGGGGVNSITAGTSVTLTGTASDPVINVPTVKSPNATSASVGNGALGSIQPTGFANTALGAFAGASITTGQANVIIGDSTMYSSTLASHNVIIGHGAGGSVQLNGNVGVGDSCLVQGTGASNNVAIGYLSMNAPTTACSNNVCVGYNTGQNLTNSTGNVLIGASADCLNPGYSNSIGIGPGVKISASNQLAIKGPNTALTFTNGAGAALLAPTTWLPIVVNNVAYVLPLFSP